MGQLIAQMKCIDAMSKTHIKALCYVGLGINMQKLQQQQKFILEIYSFLAVCLDLFQKFTC